MWKQTGRWMPLKNEDNLHGYMEKKMTHRTSSGGNVSSAGWQVTLCVTTCELP